MDSFEKFDQTQLPTKSEFYSLITDSDISIDDYEHAQKIWTEFDMKTMKDYLDLYLKTDCIAPHRCI